MFLAFAKANALNGTARQFGNPIICLETFNGAQKSA
jgi:hypothetical protein